MRRYGFLLRSFICCVLLGLSFRGLTAQAVAAPLAVVAAEAVWGDLVAQIGGDATTVSSLLSAPEADPHLFEPSPGEARIVATAAIAIANGAGFDPWMDRLVLQEAGARLIRVSDLVDWHEGDNPHLWFDPDVMRATGHAVGAVLKELRPEAGAGIDTRLGLLDQQTARLDERIASLRQQFAGQRVSATEPLLGRLLNRLGLVTANDAFQRAVMNDVEPGPVEVARFESDLRSGRLRLLIYNSQTVTPATSRLLEIAHTAHVPCVAVSELLPAGRHWQDWLAGTLTAIENALTMREIDGNAG